MGSWTISISAAYQVEPVTRVCLHLCHVESPHRLTQEYLLAPNLVVSPDHDGYVHVESHEGEDVDEGDEDRHCSLRICREHPRIEVLAEHHLKACERGLSQRLEQDILLPEENIASRDVGHKEQHHECGVGKHVVFG